MEYLNLYKVYFKTNNHYTDFITYQELEMICNYLKSINELNTIEIFSIDLPNITNKLEIMKG